MTLPQIHLAAEAVAAYVDRELASTPESRAVAHLRYCPECQAAVAQQRQAKTVLFVAVQPAPSADLLSRLRDIPMTTELMPPGTVLALEGSVLVFGNPDTIAARARSTRPKRSDRPARRSRESTRPAQPRPARTRHQPLPMRALCRGLAGAAAAVVVGMLVATTASTQASSGVRGPAATPPSSQAGTTDVGFPSILLVGGSQDDSQPLLVRAASVSLGR